jgi:hypothetical protein
MADVPPSTATPQSGGSESAAPGKASGRVFLVVVDETEEMRVALRFAALRARSTGG